MQNRNAPNCWPSFFIWLNPANHETRMTATYNSTYPFHRCSLAPHLSLYWRSFRDASLSRDLSGAFRIFSASVSSPPRTTCERLNTASHCSCYSCEYRKLSTQSASCRRKCAHSPKTACTRPRARFRQSRFVGALGAPLAYQVHHFVPRYGHNKTTSRVAPPFSPPDHHLEGVVDSAPRARLASCACF
jgi:hypothetical protein